MKRKDGGDLVERFHRWIASSVFDLSQGLDAYSAVFGKFWLSETAHFPHRNDCFCNG